jgi:hypothetical protein
VIDPSQPSSVQPPFPASNTIMRSLQDGNEDEEQSIEFSGRGDNNEEEGEDSNESGWQTAVPTRSSGGHYGSRANNTHRRNISQYLPAAVNDALDVLHSNWAASVRFVQQTFEDEEKLNQLVISLKIASFGLVITVIILLMIQHGAGNVQNSTGTGVVPSYMPTAGPRKVVSYATMKNQMVKGIPSSYLYQVDICLRECYRAPLYRAPLLSTLSQCGSDNAYSYVFVGIQNAANDQIEIGTLQYGKSFLQASATNPSNLAINIDGNDGPLYSYGIDDGQGKRTIGFSSASQLSFSRAVPILAGTDCTAAMFFTITTSSYLPGTTDFAGYVGCERVSNSSYGLGALHELVLYVSTC